MTATKLVPGGHKTLFDDQAQPASFTACTGSFLRHCFDRLPTPVPLPVMRPELCLSLSRAPHVARAPCCHRRVHAQERSPHLRGLAVTAGDGGLGASRLVHARGRQGPGRNTAGAAPAAYESGTGHPTGVARPAAYRVAQPPRQWLPASGGCAVVVKPAAQSRAFFEVHRRHREPPSGERVLPCACAAR